MVYIKRERNEKMEYARLNMKQNKKRSSVGLFVSVCGDAVFTFSFLSLSTDMKIMMKLHILFF